MNPSRILVPLLILVGLAALGYWLFGRTDDVAPIPQRQEPVAQEPAEEPDAPAANVATSDPVVDDEPEPEQPQRTVAVANNTNDDAAQGVKGRVMLPNGAPAAGIPVYLIESMMNDPIKVFLMSKSGRTPPPVSFGQTDEAGLFALGIRDATKSYDLRLTSDSHPEINQKSIKVEDDWYDTGDIRLENGLVIAGRVVDEITKAPVAQASVYLTGSNQAHTMLPTPGRERGILAVTDNTGAFRFENAPTEGMINLLAEAPGYASARLDNRNVKDTNDVLLEISKGQPIAGVVVDVNGEPLGNVKVTAQGLSQKTPQTESTTTGSDGVFRFPSLREGPYTLNAASNSHAESKTPPVLTGDLEVKVVMIERPWVKLHVAGARGEEIKAYRVSLKRYFPNNPLGIGNVPEFRDRSVTPADYPSNLGGQWAVIRGVPAGEFVFQIEDRLHAKSLSEPFTVREGGDPVEVNAQLTLGASITGRVVDDAGAPVAGALVSTDMNNAFQGDGGGIFELFKSMIPERHTKQQKRTERDGTFRFDKLAFADYMVRVGHPDFCEGRQLDITLAKEGEIVDVGTIQLARGTILEGYTTITGQAAGQIKVSISVPPEEQQAMTQQAADTGKNGASVMAQMFSASVVSDNNGHYRLLKRVPPGRYKVYAARGANDNNPFNVLLDMRETEKIVELRPGEDRRQIDFDLPSR